MTKTSGARHTLGFKQEATKLVKGWAKYCCGCENTGVVTSTLRVVAICAALAFSSALCRPCNLLLQRSFKRSRDGQWHYLDALFQ